MKNFFKNKKRLVQGFMMVEVLIAASIVVVLTLSMMSVIQRGLVISRQSLHSTQAAFLLEEGAESVRIIRDNAWTNISSLSVATNYYPTFSSNTWTLSLTPNQVGSFTRTINISAVNRNAVSGDISNIGTDDSGTKLITVNVSWQESGQTITKNLSFYISNIFL